jgi:hypothetical protein
LDSQDLVESVVTMLVAACLHSGLPFAAGFFHLGRHHMIRGGFYYLQQLDLDLKKAGDIQAKVEVPNRQTQPGFYLLDCYLFLRVPVLTYFPCWKPDEERPLVLVLAHSDHTVENLPV